MTGSCLICFGQGLGPNKNDDLEISSVSGQASTNIVMNKQWLYRSEAGNDWYTSMVVDGISIDYSFLKPGTSRTWWLRNPFSGAQSWGNAGETYMGIYGGNLGIGTTDTKGYKLAVAGNVIAESVKVQLRSAWPDYVFSKDYTPPSLKEMEKHIKEKGHLLGIPSAAEVKNNGIDLGEMNARLLQKIEELTLHLIAQDKKLALQQLEINELKQNHKL
ncbi:hypothetical protein DBR11_26330 [Pedobacter sp. HMWF019]|nr:hypothetical protein DBR11_26330 [Pedobacter sp. HMWF019]